MTTERPTRNTADDNVKGGVNNASFENEPLPELEFRDDGSATVQGHGAVGEVISLDANWVFDREVIR